MIKTLWIRQPYLDHILAGRKTIEVRVGYPNIRRLRPGDQLLLNDQHLFSIRRIGRYKSFEELLAAEDPARIAPDLSPKELLEALREIYQPEKEALGVVALEIEPASQPQEPNVVFFDLETQRSFQEVGGRHNIPRLGLSVAVTYSTADGQYHYYTEENVADLIEELKAADLVVGFNLLRFDYEVLRAYTDYPLRHLPTLDIMDDLYRRLGFRLSLDALAGATLGAAKSADGLQAIRWWRQGRMEELFEYCRRDVEVTRQLYEFGRKNKYVQYRDKRWRIKKVPVNW